MVNFEQQKLKYDKLHSKDKKLKCFLPVHLTVNGKETNVLKKNGTHNEQYYKWQFLNSFVDAGFCSKDYIGTEVQFPKGNKT